MRWHALKRHLDVLRYVLAVQLPGDGVYDDMYWLDRQRLVAILVHYQIDQKIRTEHVI